MTKIQNEIEQKLSTIADRVVFSKDAVTAIRAGGKMDPYFFAQQVAEVLGLPLMRYHHVVVDCGSHTGRTPISDYIWASLLIDDYRTQQAQKVSRAERKAGLVSLGALIERRMKGNRE